MYRLQNKKTGNVEDLTEDQYIKLRDELKMANKFKIIETFTASDSIQLDGVEVQDIASTLNIERKPRKKNQIPPPENE
jgi:hypothetical protein